MAELEVGDPRPPLDRRRPGHHAPRRATRSTPMSRRCGRRGFAVTRAALPEARGAGTFVAPTLIEIDTVADRRARGVRPGRCTCCATGARRWTALIDAINATGYGLTFGLHTRIDETIARVVERIEAGNIYVNRNIIGAIVGVQPFGGARPVGHRPEGGRAALSRAPRRGAAAGRARRARGVAVRARRAARLYRLAARVGTCRGGRALRRPRLALAARRARRAPGAGRRAQRLCARAGAAGSRRWRRAAAPR